MVKKYWKRAIRATIVNVLFFLISKIPISRFMFSTQGKMLSVNI